MTIPYSLAEHLQSAIGHDNKKETHHLGTALSTWTQV